MKDNLGASIEIVMDLLGTHFVLPGLLCIIEVIVEVSEWHATT